MTASLKTLAIVARVPAPYRIHQHRRIARELGGDVELWSLFLYEHNNLPWSQPLPAEIRPVVFGPGENVQDGRGAFGWLHEWRKMGRVIQWLQQKRVDAVITVGYSNPGHPRLISWCRRAGIPNFLYGDSNVHGDNTCGWRRKLKRLYISWVLRNVSGVMPHSARGRQYFEAYGGAEKPMFYVPQEPDYASIFSVTAERRTAARAKFGLRDDRRYFLYSGRLAGVKGIDTLIDAFATIADKRPDWDLLIVGSGPMEDQLRRRVPAEIKDRVIWTGFVNDPDQMAAINAASDVFVLPSTYEPWALVVLEAAAAGLPIISSHVVGAAGDLVKDDVNGRLVTPRNVAELSSALLDVTVSSEKLQALSQGSLEVLDDWRRRADPMQGVRQALAHAGVLPPPPPMGEPNPPTPEFIPWRSAVAIT